MKLADLGDSLTGQDSVAELMRGWRGVPSEDSASQSLNGSNSSGQSQKVGPRE